MEFAGSTLTSYAGLELLLRYLRAIRFNRLLRGHWRGGGLGGDFGCEAMIRVLLSTPASFVPKSSV